MNKFIVTIDKGSHSYVFKANFIEIIEGFEQIVQKTFRYEAYQIIRNNTILKAAYNHPPIIIKEINEVRVNNDELTFEVTGELLIKEK